MSESPLLWLIPGLPLAGAVISGVFGPRYLRERSHWPVLAALIGACGITLMALLQVIGGVDRIHAPAATWFQFGNLDVSYSIVIDPLSATMLTAITFIGFWIALFSVGYMAGDPGYPRYFAVLSLFVTMMCVLVLADNLLLLFAGWEGVGLCSYLLIGFWFAKPSAALAARKAFLTTRIGDAGLLLGIFMLWVHGGYTVEFDKLFQAAKSIDPAILNLACILLFCGAVGKSAQFPLHVWLPDAMEGPTPASALIHAATMVTAGVYLVARCMPLYHLAELAQMIVAIIAITTAMLAALIALTQHDLKRVMAYSTVSQLGMMFLALGTGLGELAVFGVAAAIFHLFTHAFFKALLFLSSGSVMHAMGNVIDMRRIGGLRGLLPVTHATFLCGAAALAGIPPLAGFWSKDQIIETDLIASHNPHANGTFYFVLFVLAMLTALTTAFYTFRAYFRTFWGEVKVPPEAGSHGHGHDHAADAHAHARGHAPAHAHHGAAHAHHDAAHATGAAAVHESPSVMTIPLIVLAVGAVCVGALLGPTHYITAFLARTPAFVKHLPEYHVHEGLDWALLGGSMLVALTGATLAYFAFVRNPNTEADVARTFPRLYGLSQNRFYFDELYKAILVIPAQILAKISNFFDILVDGIVDLVGLIPSWIGSSMRPIQNGLVQFYALAMVLGLTVFLGILTLRGGR